MGQGTFTSCPMLVAEELEVDLSQVQTEQAPPSEALYRNQLIGVQMTGGSTSIRAFYEPLRRAGATAREMLLAAAAAAWNVDASTCRAEKGSVIHTPTGRTLDYGALADKAATIPVPKDVALKEPKDFKLIGTPAKRLDTPDKVNGKTVYGIDVKVPGMKVGTLTICPVFGGKLKSVDDSKALAVKDVLQVVRVSDAVAVIAAHMGAAKKGLAALAIEWDEGPHANLTTADIVADMAKASEAEGVTVRNDGDVAKALTDTERKVDAIYQVALPGSYRHGARQLYRGFAQGRLRHLGRNSGHWPGASRRSSVDRPAAGKSHRAQPHARRRLWPAPRGRLYREGRGDRQTSRRTGQSHLESRGRRPARYVPSVLLHPLACGSRL